MKLKTWFKNLKINIAIKLSNLFISLANFFVKRNDSPTEKDDPKIWFKDTFGVDSDYIVKIITLCEASSNYIFKKFGTVKLSDEEYKKVLDDERKESVKLHSMFKGRLVPHFNPEIIEKHNERIKHFTNDFNLAALMRRDESEGKFLLERQGSPTDIIPPKNRSIK
jgi:hypothetical protein